MNIKNRNQRLMDTAFGIAFESSTEIFFLSQFIQLESIEISRSSISQGTI